MLLSFAPQRSSTMRLKRIHRLRVVVEGVDVETSEQPKMAFETSYGRPVVHKYVKYSDLLRDIRLEKVNEIFWFTQEEDRELEGPCLVEYKDGKLKQAHIPPSDLRLPYAMSAHGVVCHTLRPQPSERDLNPVSPPSDFVIDMVAKIAPLILIGFVYAAVRYMAWQKGDVEDRRMMRQKERRDARLLRREIAAEREEEEAQTLASMGWTTEEIVRELTRTGKEVDLEYVQRLVKRAEEGPKAETPKKEINSEEDIQRQIEIRKKRLEELARDSENPMDQVESLLSLSTLKIRRAKKPQIDEKDERDNQRKLRQLGRQMGQRGMKLQYTEDDTVFFDDVAGVGNAKFEVMEVVDFFTNPTQFRHSGARIPRGVLLCGPPGCGKTLLARAVAGEAGANFLSVNASEFVEMFIGVGASRVRDLFQEARRYAPAIVFVDEIDAVGRTRGGAMGNDERDQTVNQLLSELDGFNTRDGDIVVMAATNRRDVLDPALIRAGRFDRIIYVGLPDFNGRIEILEVHLAKHPTEGDIDVRELAFETQRYSGAGLANLVNLAALMAGKKGREKLQHSDILEALEYERLGPLREPYSDGRQKRLAVQEAATCVAATLLPSIEPVVYVTIIPREKYPMGQTVLKINEQREFTQLWTRRYLEDQLLMVLSSRAAEEIVFGVDEMSTINQRRLVMARRIVQKLMVSSGLEPADGIGPRSLTIPQRSGRATKQVVPPRVTIDTYETVEAAMEKKLHVAYSKAMDFMERNRKAVSALTDALVAKNLLSGDEVREIVEKHAHRPDLRRRELQVAKFL